MTLPQTLFAGGNNNMSINLKTYTRVNAVRFKSMFKINATYPENALHDDVNGRAIEIP